MISRDLYCSGQFMIPYLTSLTEQWSLGKKHKRTETIKKRPQIRIKQLCQKYATPFPSAMFNTLTPHSPKNQCPEAAPSSLKRGRADNQEINQICPKITSGHTSINSMLNFRTKAIITQVTKVSLETIELDFLAKSFSEI